jgi:radical SAM/Cys-rich protein
MVPEDAAVRKVRKKRMGGSVGCRPSDHPCGGSFLSSCGGELKAREMETIQVNVGLRCNQACLHCHVEASPTRAECMDPAVMQQVIDAAEHMGCSLVDITGGAPEMHTDFRWFISSLRERDLAVQVRTNLTILLEEGFQDIPELYRKLCVKLVASLPYYLEGTVRAQRGSGTYEKSIEVIKKLNSLGYGIEGGLPLELVYNPTGPSLPPDQAGLEAEYRRELSEKFGIHFTRLLTITNMPIGRFFDRLAAKGEDQEYMDLLRGSFNPATVDQLMCRNQINVRWDGLVFDCDFNLALGLPASGLGTIGDLHPDAVVGRSIVTGDHCFGCTAGAGSSCFGSLV